MTRSNCSIVGCNTTRKHKDIGQLRCPDPKKYPQWNKEFLSVVTKDRVVDDKFKKQIEKNNVYVCQRHFNDEDLWHCKVFVTFILIIFWTYLGGPIN